MLAHRQENAAPRPGHGIGVLYFPSGFKSFTSSAWMNSLPQITLPVLSGSSSPSMPETMPSASRTMICPRGQVPRPQVALPIAVEAARGDESHVERGGAEPAQARHLV